MLFCSLLDVGNTIENFSIAVTNYVCGNGSKVRKTTYALLFAAACYSLSSQSGCSIRAILSAAFLAAISCVSMQLTPLSIAPT